MPAVLETRGLTKRFGDVTAVSELSVAVQEGTVTGFLGPNGAGKTTTLRMLLGLAEPTDGQALVFGLSYRELEQPARRVGAVLEASDLHPGRPGRDHLRVLAAAAGVTPARVDEVLRLVELDAVADRRAGGYSLGMRQRLSLATALLGDPELLVLDEPANGLDPEGVRWLRDFLRAFGAEGRTVLVSSHRSAASRWSCGRSGSSSWASLEPIARTSPSRERAHQTPSALAAERTAGHRGSLGVAIFKTEAPGRDHRNASARTLTSRDKRRQTAHTSLGPPADHQA
jgi:ABC-type Na+ transport system ATPase subunit NatA